MLMSDGSDGGSNDDRSAQVFPACFSLLHYTLK